MLLRRLSVRSIIRSANWSDAMNASFEQMLVDVWRQALVENAEAVVLADLSQLGTSESVKCF